MQLLIISCDANIFFNIKYKRKGIGSWFEEESNENSSEEFLREIYSTPALQIENVPQVVETANVESQAENQITETPGSLVVFQQNEVTKPKKQNKGTSNPKKRLKKWSDSRMFENIIKQQISLGKRKPKVNEICLDCKL